jgi:3D (Asp-Asp-Asp) domain-containing protein
VSGSQDQPPAGALGWSAMTTLTLVVGAPAELPGLGTATERAAAQATLAAARRAVPRHAPVLVTSAWAPPRAAVPTATGPGRPRTSRPRSFLDSLPRPFAEMRALLTSPLLMPRLRLPRLLTRDVAAVRDLERRATPGEPVHVVMSAYCLRGTTRSGTSVRTGIVAADPRVFPLRRRVELFAGGRYLGQFRVEDTGSKIRGTRIDIWTPDCADARQFGMRRGVAAMVASGGS